MPYIYHTCQECKCNSIAVKIPVPEKDIPVKRRCRCGAYHTIWIPDHQIEWEEKDHDHIT